MSNPKIEADLAVVANRPGDVDQDRSYVDWPAILAGAVVAWATTFVLATFGSGIGLTMTDGPWREGVSVIWFFAAAALWFIWVQVSSVMAGGYLAGRLRRRLGDANGHEIEVRDGAHGLLVWGVSALVGAAIALLTAAGGIGAAANLSGNIATSAASNALQDTDLEYAIDRLFRPNASSEQLMEAVADGDADATVSVHRIISASGLNGEISAEDKTYIASLVAAETGLSEAEAQERVDLYLTKAIAAARDAAETARKMGILAAFLTAATLLVSAIGGWWAAGVGGRHRDENVDLTRWFRVR